MNLLLEVISNLDGYTLGHIQKKIENDHSKAFELFTGYKESRKKDPDDEYLMKKIYGSGNSEKTYYRLKNRLISVINSALLDIYMGAENSELPAEKNYLLYKIFKSKNKIELAEYYLLRSVKYAESSEQFALLDILYGEMTLLCKDTLHHDPDVFIKKRRENVRMLNNIRTIDEILAVLTYRLKSTQNLSGTLNVTVEIDETLEKFSTDAETLKSKQFKTKFYKTVSHILIQQKKYPELESFVSKTFDEFNRDNFFTRQNHDIKIEQLVYLINSLLFQHKYKDVLEINERLFSEMLKFDKLLFDKYEYFYYQSKINAYAALDVEKAIEVQKQILEKQKIIKEPNFVAFNYSNLAYLYFIKRNFKQVVKTLQRVYTHDFYGKMDLSIKTELMMIELISRLELQDGDVFEYRLRQIGNELESENKWVKKSVFTLVQVINLVFTNQFKINAADIMRNYETYKKQKQKETPPVFSIDFWLKEKLGP